MKDIIIALIGLISGGGVTLIGMLLKRKWTKQDEAEKITPERIEEIEKKIEAIEQKIDAIIRFEKVSAIDRIHYLGLCHLGAKSITLEDKETFYEMCDAAKGLGVDGRLTPIMEEVGKVQLVKSRFGKDENT